jgi:hypothetical protein
VRRSHPDVVVELEIDATDKVAHFANVPGLYRHWSLLARYRGHIDYRHHRDEVEGLCTFEYSVVWFYTLFLVPFMCIPPCGGTRT